MNSFWLNFNQSLGSSLMTILGALLIFVVGWIIAATIGALVHKLLERVGFNQRMNASTGKAYDMAHIISRLVFWFVFIIAVAGALSFLRLDAISAPFAAMIAQVLAFIPHLLAAGALAVVGWVVATVARTALTATLDRTTLDERLSTEAGVQPMSANIANLAYWFILLMFLPMVLEQLGLTALLEPVNLMLAKALAYLPQLVAAAVLLLVGYVIAKILRGITTNVVASLNLQSLAHKAGVGDHTQLAKLAGMLVYLMVMITTIIMALEALQIEAIARPATNMLNEIMLAIPNIIAAVAILGIAYYVVRFIADIIKNLLENSGVNELPAKIGLQDILGTTKLSDLVGNLLMFFVMLFASIEAANFLGFAYISNLISMFIVFGAQVLLGAVILGVGFWLANILAGAVQRSQSPTQQSSFLPNLVRILIMGLVLAMGLRAMGIADSIVNMAFGLTLGAVAVAFALAFGLGGREAAARLLKNWQDKAEREAANPLQNSPSLSGFGGIKPTTTQQDADNSPLSQVFAPTTTEQSATPTTATLDLDTSIHSALEQKLDDQNLDDTQ